MYYCGARPHRLPRRGQRIRLVLPVEHIHHRVPWRGARHHSPHSQRDTRDDDPPRRPSHSTVARPVGTDIGRRCHVYGHYPAHPIAYLWTAIHGGGGVSWLHSRLLRAFSRHHVVHDIAGTPIPLHTIIPHPHWHAVHASASAWWHHLSMAAGPQLTLCEKNVKRLGGGNGNFVNLWRKNHKNE